MPIRRSFAAMDFPILGSASRRDTLSLSGFFMYFPVASGVHRDRLLNYDAKAGFDGCKKK
jgi:hypothetical protein